MSSQNHTPQGYATTHSMKRNPMSPRTLFSTFMNYVVFACVALALLPLLAVLFYVMIQGFSTLNGKVLTQQIANGGFANAMVGTLIMVGIGALISVPFGVLAAIYLSEFSSGKIAEWTRFATNVLSGVPSIIVGVFAYAVVVLDPFGLLGYKGYSGWAGGFALSILMLPIIVRTTDEALKLVPQELRQAAVGLGATNFQTVVRVVLPAAIPAILTGVTLGVARAAGETAPLLFTALMNEYWINWSLALKQPTASLSVLVFNYATSFLPAQQALAWAASFILVLMVLVASVIARFATSRKIS